MYQAQLNCIHQLFDLSNEATPRIYLSRSPHCACLRREVGGMCSEYQCFLYIYIYSLGKGL